MFINDHIKQVKEFFAQHTSVTIFRHVLGIEPIPDAPAATRFTVVNSIDTEAYEWNHSKLTEIGFNAFSSSDLRRHAANPGPNAEHMLKEIYYYHFRMKANTHLVNRRFCKGNPEANRFGNTRFTNDTEARTMLEESFAWDLDQTNPEAGKCPVILLGHALSNDAGALGSTIGFDAYASSNVVAVIDTQQMAHEVGIYNPAGQNNEVCLRTLAGHFNIPYRDPHTAGNDAAYMTIAAIYIALYNNQVPSFSKTITESIDEVEARSVVTSVANFGIADYCTRCHSRGHIRRQCSKKIPPCEKCQARRTPDANGKLSNVFLGH